MSHPKVPIADFAINFEFNSYFRSFSFSSNGNSFYIAGYGEGSLSLERLSKIANKRVKRMARTHGPLCMCVCVHEWNGVEWEGKQIWQLYARHERNEQNKTETALLVAGFTLMDLCESACAEIQTERAKKSRWL